MIPKKNKPTATKRNETAKVGEETDVPAYPGRMLMRKPVH